jgi:hypothetical protein
MVKKGSSTAIIFIAILALISGCATPAIHHADAPVFQSGYAPVNGLKMYYEIYGSDIGWSPPLILLHGGGSTIETSFGKVLPALNMPCLCSACSQTPDSPFCRTQTT